MAVRRAGSRYPREPITGRLPFRIAPKQERPVQTRTCLTVGASSAFPPVADIQCGCVELFSRAGFWEHRLVKVKRSNGRALGCSEGRQPRARAPESVPPGRTLSCYSALLLERPRWQGQGFSSAPAFRGFTLLPTIRHLRTNRSIAQRVLKGFEGFRAGGTTSAKGQKQPLTKRGQLLRFANSYTNRLNSNTNG